MTGHILIVLDTIFNRLKFPFIAPRHLFLPGQPAKFLLVPSSFRAFLASSSLLAEDLTWHVACLLCPHPTREFPAFENLLLPMPAIPLNSMNSWGGGSGWRECRWHFGVVAITTATCSNTLCDIGRLQGSNVWMLGELMNIDET